MGGGTRTTITPRGMGVSWGFAGFRVGKSPTGSLWVSFTIPGTGISFFKYLAPQTSQTAQQQQPSIPAKSPAPALPQSKNSVMTANERVLEEIRRSKP
ncbi:MAG: DUF4236 domain-containing protein [Rhodocyclales bacterium]|nr:DUF4236 domain-containing protein [Rhodocyclales bacterium]